MVESSVAARWSGMGSAVVRGFGRARAGACLAAAPAASSRAVVGPKPGPGRRGGRLDILAALLRGARAAAFALAALALGVPGEAEAQDVLFVSNLDQDDDNNSNDARDRAQRFTTGSNPAGYTLTSVEIRSEDAESDDATVSICTIDGRGYPTSSCTLLTVPSSFAAGILVFSAPNDHSLSANTSYTLVVRSPGGESLDLDATRADGEDSAEVAGWSIADAHNTNNTSGWGISGSGKSLRIAVKGLVKIASNAATGIVHPRVLMDTQITVGGYRTTTHDAHAGLVDYWGYAAGPAIGTDNVVEMVHVGSLGDTAFVYRGVEYTVKRLTMVSGGGSFEIEIEDAVAAALPDTAAVGIELQGSPTGETVLFDWRQRAEEAVDEEVETLLTAWRNAPLTVLPLRILNLHASDVWSADLQYGPETSLTVGYGAPATGTLTATGFALDGVEYTVDRLTVASTTEAQFVVRFATTPDLPATARLRLAVPRALPNPGLNRYLALEPASRVSGGTDVDYEWPWSGSIPGDLQNNTAPVYLTRAPGRTGDVSGFWEATLTPNERDPDSSGADLVGYRGAGLSITDFAWESAGAGTLASASVSLRGVDYTVEVLAVVSNTVDYLHVALRTDPLLPRGQDLWLELGHVDGSTAAFAIDTASVEAPGYLWRDVYAGEDLHGWGTDSAYNDTAIDSVTVRLSTGAPTITGTAQVGQTLTAVTTGITDAHGLTSATYTYQWIQVNGTAADIAGENSSTYTLVDADLGKAIKVKVSFTDDASNAETRTSAATATVTADPTTSVSGVLVSNVGQTGVDGILFSGNDAAQSFTTGAHATGYTLTSIELRLNTTAVATATPTVKLFSVSATGTEEATFTGPAMLDASTTENYTFTPSTTVNLLASTTYWVVGEGGSAGWAVTLTSEDATSAAGWEIGDREIRSPSSTGGFTASTGTAFMLRVNGTLGSTTVTNNPPTVANAIQDQTATVGTALDYAFPADTFADTDAGDTLTYTATKSDDSALPAWLSFDAATRTFSGTPQAADVETVSVKVTASDGNGGSVSDTFDIVVSAAANNPAMGAPTITGTAQVGETLTAVTTGITDADGLTSVTYTYQWIRANGTEADIASENSSTYILVAADLGKTIKVKVSFTDDASNDETLTSAATATVTAAPTAPMVTDVDVTSMPASDDTYGTGEMIKFTVTFDQAVTVVGTPEFEFCLGSTATVSCSVGMPPPALRSAALLSGSGTTALVFSYTVLVGDVDDNGIYVGNQNDTIKLDGGDTIQGTVGGLTAVLTHTAVGSPTGHKVNGAAANTAAMGAPTITGTAQVGETLTAATTGITDADGLTSVTYTYQWIRANGTEADIASANSSTYILIAADLGKTIKVKVSFTDDASNAETLTSAATATVVAAPTAPMVTDVDVTSSPDSGDTYGTGEMILFTVTFDQSVTVTGMPEFEFCLGMTGTMSCDVGTTPPARRRAALSSGSGTTALVFGYTVVAGDVDDNGIWIGDQSRTIKLVGGTIQGTVGGLDAVLTHAEEGEQADHKVNGAAANTAPTAAHNTVTTGEDRAYTFTAADFGFMDADAGAALASVKIVTVPGAGTLALDGTAVMAADVVTEAQIDADMLTFRPAQDAHGAPYTTFTFKVNDGTDDSASAYTMTIDVTDAPAPVCTAPSFGDRREIWSGTVTVERIEFLGS